ncbi:glutathione S-transferase family protein [Sphingopyxis sp. JAI128]|uniref:glutathione S-transferase family protein n=1 Tax=Sphingopyxis sp. JAI128 TaxID=2723066 RepID=UPI001613782D|nr:glutathione S-transferase family protein [Sphingopyxis sp. JAI128]MBB6424329.1 glutathione S-transferase [Sphingopyxis sp. JAI128]
MIFYDSPNPAPNPRRVRIFAAEKGIDLPSETISIVAGEQKTPAYLAINPRGQTPALRLDDGSVLTESVAICRYLEALYPDAPLFGATPAEIGAIEMWIRRVELVLMEPISKIWLHTHPFTARLPIQRFPDYGEANRPRAMDAFAMCDAALGQSPWLAGEAFSVADILLLTAVDFAAFIGVPFPDDLGHLRSWRQRMSARPSATA